ncbi:ABC transporter ATP-binding protein [Cupriavidus sp. UYMSc13B]|nr:ABC transporter ATP-binding protein [Cupriavidus sp. UYMSc13B]
MSSVVPLRLEVASAEGTLFIDWPDGRHQSLAHAWLRAACRCSDCRRQPVEAASAQDVRIVAVNEMGYGVQLVFNDGHERGIFPWSYLWAL